MYFRKTLLGGRSHFTDQIFAFIRICRPTNAILAWAIKQARLTVGDRASFNGIRMHTDFRSSPILYTRAYLFLLLYDEDARSECSSTTHGAAVSILENKPVESIPTAPMAVRWTTTSCMGLSPRVC